MIISRAPLRITLGGGGTDLPFYYTKYGGFLISATINKYVFVGANKQFYNNVSLKYSKIEIKDKLSDIEHPLFREALKYLSIKSYIELTSLADIPSGTGLGSSGAFLICLLNTLHHYKEEPVNKRELAEEAYTIIHDILNENEGKQDIYISAFGGIKILKIEKNGFVNIIPITNEDIIKSVLEKHLIIFFTGMKRKGTASSVIKKQNNTKTFELMHSIKKIGLLTKEAFEQQDFDNFGVLLNEHWKIKKKYSPDSTDDFIDECYELAIDSGCLGGKIMGAGGGGGFFMFYHPHSSHTEFIKKMEKKNLHYMPFKFDDIGVTII